MKIDNGMIVKVVDTACNGQEHFGHLNEVGVVENRERNRFFIRFENESCGWWYLENIEIIDRKKEERIKRRLKQIENIKKIIEEIENE